jgi:hypothetical protein
VLFWKQNKYVQTHQRKSIRLKEYDYSQPGDYFVTIYTQGHKHTFAAIAGYEMQLNKIGNIVKNAGKGHLHILNTNSQYLLMKCKVHRVKKVGSEVITTESSAMK